jgi:hypothetical protein
LKDPKYCHHCYRELTISERDLFYDDDLAVCRDCWINKTFVTTITIPFTHLFC